MMSNILFCLNTGLAFLRLPGAYSLVYFALCVEKFGMTAVTNLVISACEIKWKMRIPLNPLDIAASYCLGDASSSSSASGHGPRMGSGSVLGDGIDAGTGTGGRYSLSRLTSGTTAIAGHREKQRQKRHRNRSSNNVHERDDHRGGNGDVHSDSLGDSDIELQEMEPHSPLMYKTWDTATNNNVRRGGTEIDGVVLSRYPDNTSAVQSTKVLHYYSNQSQSQNHRRSQSEPSRQQHANTAVDTDSDSDNGSCNGAQTGTRWQNRGCYDDVSEGGGEEEFDLHLSARGELGQRRMLSVETADNHPTYFGVGSTDTGIVIVSYPRDEGEEAEEEEETGGDEEGARKDEGLKQLISDRLTKNISKDKPRNHLSLSKYFHECRIFSFSHCSDVL